MKLYIGSIYQGQEELARAENTGGTFWPDFHETIRSAVLTDGHEPREFARQFCQKHPDAIVIANEVGAGVVPMAREDRAFREAVGRALCVIAQEAESVTRCVCGIGGADQMKWILIRHGQTQGNQEHRYIGCRTDKSLCPEGIAALQGKAVPPAVKVFVSLMKRCLETAALIYPGVPVEIVDDLRECAIVARGGTIMAIMEQFALPKGTYFDYQVHNGCGFILEDDGSYQTI